MAGCGLISGVVCKYILKSLFLCRCLHKNGLHTLLHILYETDMQDDRCVKMILSDMLPFLEFTVYLPYEQETVDKTRTCAYYRRHGDALLSFW